MTPDDQEERTVETLKQKIREHVRKTGSTQGEFEKEFAYAGWFQQLGRQRIHLKTSILYKVLDALDIAPLDFFAEIFLKKGEPTSPKGSKIPGSKIPGPGPHGNQIAAANWSEKVDDQPADGARMARIRAWLERLDDERYTEATRVSEEIQAALEQGEIPREAIHLCLGVQGSCYRLMYDYARAEGHLRQGLAYAEGAVALLDVARLRRRLATVNISQGHLDAAAKENAAAYAVHQQEGDLRGMAEALVTQGAILGLAGEFERSTATFMEALENLSGSNPRYQAAALAGIARNLSMTGNASEGIDYAKRATLISTDPASRLRSRWTYGTLLAKAGQGDRGLKELREVVSKLRQHSPFDACLAGIDFCSELLRSGRPQDAHRAARELLPLSGPVGKVSKPARLVIVELATIGDRGQGLTVDTLEVLRQKLATDVGSQLGLRRPKIRPHRGECKGQQFLHPEECRGPRSLHPD